MNVPRISVWAPLRPTVYLGRRVRALPFPLGRPSCTLFSRARHGLWQGVQALELAPGDAVLAPAYHHGSEIEALLRAGLDVRFYDVGESLEPDAGALERQLDERVRALHLIHYLGFPQDGARWRAWCDERGLLLLEDAAQAWLAEANGTPVGSHGQLAVFCLYKTIGVPDGAALVVDAPSPAPESPQPRGVGPAARRHALWLLQRWNGLPSAGGERGSSVQYDAAQDFALGDPGLPPTAATATLLPRIADETVAGLRRANYRILLDELGEQVAEPFASLPSGASPFAFPVETDRKAELLARLDERRVGALDFWSEPHPALPVDSFPAAASRRARTVALPVHQELRYDDLELIASAVGHRRRRRPPLRLEQVPLDALEGDWNRLAERTENIFATWEWASTWWRHYGADREPLVTTCRSDGGRLVAILPLYVYADGPVRVLRFIGHGPADELGPICAPEDRNDVARAVRRLLTEIGADVLLAENLSRDRGWGTLLGARVLKREGSPVLRFDGDSWDDLRARWSSNLRQQAGRFERRLAREHGLRYELADDAERLSADLDDLFALHAARWSAETSAFLGEPEPFHRDFARQALERGWLRLWFLVAEEQRVAAWYGFRFGSVESFYQAGREPDWEERSVGFVLLLHSIREALESGMREYRFLRGDEPFKYRLASSDPGLETLGIARGPVGSMATVAGGMLRRPLVPLLERRLAGRR